jgi:hypothetical protein
MTMDGGRSMDALDEVDFHALDEIVINHGVLVGFRVEEMIAAAVLVGIFMGHALQQHAVHRIVGGEPEVEHLLGCHAADGHLDVGRHARRRLEFVIDHDTDFVVVADGVSLAEVDYWSAGHGVRGDGIGA